MRIQKGDKRNGGSRQKKSLNLVKNSFSSFFFEKKQKKTIFMVILMQKT